MFNIYYTYHQCNRKHSIKPSFSIILINDGSVSSNYGIDMTSINTRMFGIMFEVSLLVASLRISTFMNKPLFIHTSEKL